MSSTIGGHCRKINRRMEAKSSVFVSGLSVGWAGTAAAGIIVAMEIVPVKLPPVVVPSYEVQIAAGLLAELGARVRQVASAPSCGIITDSNVGPHYLASATAS